MDGATVIPMKQRPDNVTVESWLQDQIDKVTAEMEGVSRDLHEAEALVTMRDGEYDDAKAAAKSAEGDQAGSDEVDAAYDRLAEANRAYDKHRLALRRLQHQFDWMSEKIKFMPKEF